MNGRTSPPRRRLVCRVVRTRSRATMPTTALHALTPRLRACARSRRPRGSPAGTRSRSMPGGGRGELDHRLALARDADPEAPLGTQHASQPPRAREAPAPGAPPRPLDLGDLGADRSHGARRGRHRPRRDRGRAAPPGRPAPPPRDSGWRRGPWCRARAAPRRGWSRSARGARDRARRWARRGSAGRAGAAWRGRCRPAAATLRRAAARAERRAAPRPARSMAAATAERTRRPPSPASRAANRRFSSTVRSPSTLVSWNTSPRRRRTGRLLAHDVVPENRAPSPRVGASSVASSSIAVVLPAPFGPSRPTRDADRHLEVQRVEGSDAAVVAPEPSGGDRRRVALTRAAARRRSRGRRTRRRRRARAAPRRSDAGAGSACRPGRHWRRRR